MTTMVELWDQMMEQNHHTNPKPYIRAHATLTEPVTLRHWNGHGTDPEFTEEELPTGTRVNVVMASRFGDVGITNDMEAFDGYQARIQCVECDGWPDPEEILTDIEIREIPKSKEEIKAANDTRKWLMGVE